MKGLIREEGFWVFREGSGSTGKPRSAAGARRGAIPA